ncbi:hypothetical protein EUGRSUZ_A00418 [Eucalyptus grandis]|uniref:Uncharacterized protein n=2 Tax=Eucalyptus grandis TaxID=71139 RepID=A0ACC3M107_EUCGR|nr:hypothetical protein EUGRSUZ_A00418 [Eucalyptus grandis]
MISSCPHIFPDPSAIIYSFLNQYNRIYPGSFLHFRQTQRRVRVPTFHPHYWLYYLDIVHIISAFPSSSHGTYPNMWS